MRSIPWNRLFSNNTSPEHFEHILRFLKKEALWFVKEDFLPIEGDRKEHVHLREWTRLSGEQRAESLFKDAPAGFCPVLVSANDTTGGRLPDRIRAGMVLPFVWSEVETAEEEGAADNLPDTLDRLARRVLQQARSDKKNPLISAGRYWQLQGFCGLQTLNMHELPLDTSDSAWGTLFTGLLMAEDGLRPKPGVFVSIAWDDEAAQPVSVSSLAQKWEAVQSFGGTHLCVGTAANAEEMEKSGVEKEGIVRSRGNTTDPMQAMLPVLRALSQKPTMKGVEGDREKEQQWKLCCAYANLLERNKQEEYNIEELHSYQAERLQVEDVNTPVQRMVLVVSQMSPPLLMLRLFRPQQALLLYTERDKKGVQKLLTELQNSPEVFPLELPETKLVVKNDFETIQKTVRNFFNSAQTDERCLLDPLGGTTGMKGAAILGAMESHRAVEICFLETDSQQGRYRHAVGTERLQWLKRN